MDVQEMLKNVLLAQVGAVALTAEKGNVLLKTLVEKGEITVEQGKALNEELKRKAEEKKEPEKKDVTSLLDGLSDEDLAKLKEAIAKKEEK